MYCSEKISNKSDILIHQSENLSKKRDNFNEYHLHQNQIVLKRHNLDKTVTQDF